MLTKERLQIYLDSDQLASLRNLSKARDMSIAALIRSAVNDWLAKQPVEDDPLLHIMGIGDSGLGDLAERHDDYLERDSLE